MPGMPPRWRRYAIVKLAPREPKERQNVLFSGFGVDDQPPVVLPLAAVEDAVASYQIEMHARRGAENVLQRAFLPVAHALPGDHERSIAPLIVAHVHAVSR